MVLNYFLSESAHRSGNKMGFLGNPQVKQFLDELFDKWLKEFPNSSTARINQAAFQYYLGKWKESKRYLDEALRIDPENIEGLNLRGWVCYNTSPTGYRSAEKDFQKIIEINPYHDSAYSNLGMIARDAYKDRKKAVEFYDKAISLNDRSKENFFGRGRAKFFLGNYEEAVNDLSRAIAIDSNYKEAYWARSECLRRLNRVEEAEADMQKSR